MFLRHTIGHSWRGANPGERHWESTTVGTGYDPLGCLLWLPFSVFGLFVLFLIWLSAEKFIIPVSGLVVLIRWVVQPHTRWRAHWGRWAWFRYLSAG